MNFFENLFYFNYLHLLIGFTIIFFFLNLLKKKFIKNFIKIYEDYNSTSKDTRALFIMNKRKKIIYMGDLVKKNYEENLETLEKTELGVSFLESEKDKKYYEVRLTKVDFFYFEIYLGVIQNVALKDNLELLKIAIDKISDIIFVTDKDGFIIYANKAFEIVTGYEYEDYYKKKPSILKSGKTPESYYKSIWNNLLNDKSFSIIVTNKKKNGEEFIYNQNITVLKDEEKKFKYYISTGRDVTESEIQKKNLMIEKNNFQTLFNKSSNLLLEIDKKLKIVEINDIGLDITNKKREDIKNQSIIKYFDLMKLEYKIEEISNLIENLDVELTTKNNEHFRIKSSILANENILIELINITESVRTELFLESKNSILEFQIEMQSEELLFERNKLYTFLNGVSIPLIILDDNFELQFINDYSKKIFDLEDNKKMEEFKKTVIYNDLILLKDKKVENKNSNITFETEYTIGTKSLNILWTLSKVVINEVNNNFILIGDDISDIKNLISHQEELLATLKRKTKDIQALYSISEIANVSKKIEELKNEVLAIVNEIWSFNQEFRIEISLFEKNYEINPKEGEEFIYINPILVEEKEVGEITLYKKIENKHSKEEAADFINSVGLILSNAINKIVFENMLIQNQENLIDFQKLGNFGTWEYLVDDEKLILSEVSRKILGIEDNENYTINEFFSCISDEEKKNFKCLIDEKKKTEYRKEIMVLYHRGNSKAINLFIQVKSVLNYSKSLKILGTLYEVTEFIEVQKQLEEAKVEAENSNKAKSIFLANMSHEIRTPLNAVLGFSQILLKNPSIKTEEKKQLRIIHNSGEHLLNLINDILDISKVESGQVQIESSKFNFKMLLKDIENMFFHKIEEKKVDLNLTYNEDTPKYLISDVKKLKQILVNLLGNAFKFTDDGSVSLDVFTKLISEDLCRIKFKIEDTGIGIDKDEVNQIFDKFYQATNSRAGTGLGLAITRNLIEILGGNIIVESEIGKGTSFEFTLEFKIDKSLNNESTENNVEIEFYNSTNKKLRALVVDDVIENIDLLSILLKQIDIDVYTGLTANEGLNLFNRLEFDVVFMDIRLPDMDGKEVIKRMKSIKKKKEFKIIGISASIFEEEINKVLESGADDFIPKPLNVNELYALLNKHFDIKIEKVENKKSEEVKKNKKNEKNEIQFEKIKISLEKKSEFIQAIDQGDFFAIGKLNEEFEDEFKEIKISIEKHLDNFDYESIRKIIEKIKVDSSLEY